eukprot:COSAG04_NODE_11511_length_705_cov_0.813531_1_plen_31_part_10
MPGLDCLAETWALFNRQGTDWLGDALRDRLD